MSKTLLFKTFCFEAYKNAHNLKGKEAIEIFKKYGVFEYLNAVYDVLHSTGEAYIVEDINIYIEARKELA